MANQFRLTKSAELESLAAFRDFIDKVCAPYHIDSQTCYELKLAVDEACTNVIEHGYAGMNPGSIMLDLEFKPAQVVIRITDFGHPFEPCEPQAPNVQAALDDRASAAFGLFIIYNTMDAVDYKTIEDGNTLTLTKQLVPAVTT